jgi:tyrosyl-tRNA synthetase
MSPYAFYQFWLNVADTEVPGLLRVYSFKPRREIEALTAESVARPAARVGQRALAEEVTTLVHGAEECRRAIATSQALFGQGSLADLLGQTLAAAAAELRPARFTVPRPPSPGAAGARVDGLPPVANLMVAAGTAPTVSAARRAIAEGGAYLNNERVTDPGAFVTYDNLLDGHLVFLRRGKRTVGAVEVITAD